MGLEDEVADLRQRIETIEQAIREAEQEGPETGGAGVSEDDRSLRASLRALKQRQDDLERTIEEEYRPALQQEQETLDEILAVMRELQDRLGAYGRMQQSIRDLEAQLDDLESTVSGKVGHGEFDETTGELEEQIRRIKARLHHIED